MEPLTRWVLAHRRLVVAFWLLVTLVGAAFASSATGALSKTFSVPGREGFEANQRILGTFHAGGNVPPIVVEATLPPGQRPDSPVVQSELRAALAPIAQRAPGSRIASLATTHDRSFVSPDARTTFALIFTPPNRAGQSNENVTAVDAVRGAVAHATVGGAPLLVTGIVALRHNTTSSRGGPGVLAEALLGGVGALVVLAFVFASMLALVPLLMAIPSILGTFLLVWGLTTFVDVSFIVEFLIALIGLGVAIDYALLVVVRWREERAHGLTNDEAVIKAMSTAGSAVVFSGTTVAVGLLALVVLPLPFLRSVGYGGMLIPLVSVSVAITLLPAVLSSVGPRMDWPRIRNEDRASASWTQWAQLVSRRRWPAAIIALIVLGALLVAAARLQPGDPKADSLAQTGDAHAGLVALERSGIGSGVLTPFEVLAPAGQAASLTQRLASVAGVRSAVSPDAPPWRAGGQAVVTVLPADDGSSAAGRATLDRVRGLAHGVAPGSRVGGQPAQNADFVSAVYGSFPLMIGLIALLTFLLLARAFRSIVLPLKAVVLNVISVAAAWGAITLVWQDGHGSSLIWGISPTGAITAWVPLMVFAFLFGLSMDYEVFILARMREEYDATGSTHTAVIRGIGRTGRLVTSAALILFLAFVSMGSGPETDIKVLATGLGAGILLDATVVRALLVPALVSLFGRWNWWLPPGPARLLRVAPSLPPRRSEEPAPAPAG